MTIIEIIAALLFVGSSGLLYNSRFRENRALILSAGAVALISTYYLTMQIADSIFSRRMHEVERGLSLALKVPEFFDQSAIWVPPGSLDIGATFNATCRFDAKERCFLDLMKSNGASPAAVRFSRAYYLASTGFAYMSAFDERGRVDVANIISPLQMNEQKGVVLVNGDPLVIDLDTVNWREFHRVLNIEDSAEFRRMLVRYPKAVLWKIIRVGPSWVTFDGKEVFQMFGDIRDGCRACKVLGEARVDVTFDRGGKFLSASVRRVASEAPAN